MIREVIFYKSYFTDFYLKQSSKVQKKIEHVIKVVTTVERVPEKFLKHLTGTKALYELRIEQGSDIYRVFCFFDKGNLVVLLHGIHKKTQRLRKLKSQRLRN